MESEMEEIKLNVSDDAVQEIVIAPEEPTSPDAIELSEEPSSEEPLAEKTVSDEQSGNEDAQTTELSPESPQQ